MILADIKYYLKEHTRASLADLSVHFDAEPDSMRGMLDQWIGKGKVRKLRTEWGCKKGCCQCDPMTLEIYEWVH